MNKILRILFVMHVPGLPRPRLCRFVLALLLGSFALCASTGSAHETDNFYLPLDVELADLGDFFGTVHTWAIEEAVAEVNARIEQASAIKDPAARARRLAQCHDPDAIASAVASRFGDAFTETYKAGRALRGSWAERAYPGKIASHVGIKMNLVGHFPLDPRALIMLAQADTVKAYGVYFGTDKLTHFHQLGWSYYKQYRSLQRQGLSKEEAYRQVLHSYADTAFLSEKNVFGTIGTGVYSNGDMCVNHVGFKFFLNLTEKVVLKEQEREPLVVRCGRFWRVNHHVRPQSGWLGAFVSDHWNEALNPSLYDATMRPGIRRVLHSRADHIVRFYTQKDGRPNDATYFVNLARELSTYYGESYGHSGQFEKLMNIGNTCFSVIRQPTP
jgi:hypothetical protein